TSDKLAQRNLTIVPIASPHQVPATFDVAPPRATLVRGDTPDELMIEWGDLPDGSRASIYLPGVDAHAIIEASNTLYTRHGLSVCGPHTLGCAASGIPYLPVLPGAGTGYAGLLTIDVPDTVARGQVYSVRVRQLRTTTAQVPTSTPPKRVTDELAQAATVV